MNEGPSELLTCKQNKTKIMSAKKKICAMKKCVLTNSHFRSSEGKRGKNIKILSLENHSLCHIINTIIFEIKF